MKKYICLCILVLTILTINSPIFASNPKPASASVYNLGLKSYEQGDTQSAITFFKRAIDIDSNFIDAHYNLGAIYKKQKNYSEAIKSFQKVVDLNPSDSEAIYELASCYHAARDYEKAKKYYSLIPSSFPRYAEAIKNVGLVDQILASSTSKTTTDKKTKTDISYEQAQLLVDTLVPSDIQEKRIGSKSANNHDPIRIIKTSFNGPTGIAKDSMDNIYVANFIDNTIEKIKSDGLKEVFIDKVGLLGPVGLAFDDNDNLYVANYNGNSIVKITQERNVSVLVDKIVRPYYLLYDKPTGKLFATVQGQEAIVEIDTKTLSKLPLVLK